MKPVITFSVAIIALSVKTIAQLPNLPGRLKVTIEKVTCVEKSWDELVEFDGHGNEISATYAYRIYSPSNPNAARKGADGTVIYGSSVNGMTRAGTQTPNLGGITNGDIISMNKLILDEHINTDEYVVIAPNVWEWDGPEKTTINSFNSQLNDDLFWVIHQPYPFTATNISYSNPFSDRVINTSKYPGYDGGTSKYAPIFRNFLCPINKIGNRPIGLVSGTYNNNCSVLFLPTLVLLDTRVLYAQYAGNRNAVSTGTSHAEKESRGYVIDGVTITFRENNYNYPDSHGTYTMTLKIEFTPDTPPASSAPVTMTPVKTIGPIKRDMPIKNIGGIYVTGNWSGTQTTDSGLYPQAVAFQLTNTGEFIMGTAAKGTYVFANNTISGSYKQFSSGETFSFSGTYDPATQKITCTLGPGTAVKGQGKWVVSKL